MDTAGLPLLDEKRGEYDELPTSISRHPPSPTARDRFVRRTLPALALCLTLWLVFRSFFVLNHHYCPHKSRLPIGDDDGRGTMAGKGDKLVPLEAHIMSKCPDARDCLQKLVVPAMVQISDKVNFTLSYIGSVDPKSDAITCMHGPPECLGNIIQLCAAKVYPDPKIYLGFANCMTSQYKDIPDRDLVEECAMEHAVDFEKLNACISDEGEGIDLLRASVERSRQNHVTKSCTIRLAGKVRCIRDGGEWYDCPGGSSVGELVAEINDLYVR